MKELYPGICCAALLWLVPVLRRKLPSRGHIASFLLAGGLAVVFLLSRACWAADNESRPASSPTFSDVIERQLSAPSYIALQQVVLNLDNGELLAMPTNVFMAGINNPRPRLNWMVKRGADLQVHSSDWSTNLTFYLDDGRLAILGQDLTFETIAASDVSRELARAGVFQHLEVPRPIEGPGATLVFKTREGGLGVMQLLGFSAKPNPILKLRYKLVRHAPATE